MTKDCEVILVLANGSEVGVDNPSDYPRSGPCRRFTEAQARQHIEDMRALAKRLPQDFSKWTPESVARVKAQKLRIYRIEQVLIEFEGRKLVKEGKRSLVLEVGEIY